MLTRMTLNNMNRFKDKRKVISLSLVGIAYALIVTPLIISNLQKQQEVRSRASTTTIQSQTCNASTANNMLVIDRSGSMNDKIGSYGTKMSNAKSGATNFVNLASQNPQNQIGLVSFASTASIDMPLSSNFDTAKNKIASLQPSGETCIQCAINKANQTFAAGYHNGAKNAMVLLTDGIANYVEGGYSKVSQSTAEQAALTAAQNGYQQNGAILFVIGVGSNVNESFLKKLASSAGGQYYYSPTSDNLNQIYGQIQQVISQGSIGGFAFHDTNHSGTYDSGEPKLSNWQVQLTQQGYGTPKVATTDENGHYLFTNLCDGTYNVKEIPPTGWTQTAPTDPNGYTVTITKGNAYTDKVFGMIQGAPTLAPTSVYQPTAVPTNVYSSPTTSGTTKLNLSILLDGIGNRGDNTNPNTSSLSNKTPQHSTIGASIEIDDSSNRVIGAGVGKITYNSATGAYEGQIPIEQGFPTGTYLIKITADTHLRKLVTGIQTITAGQLNTIPQLALVAGDANSDNSLNILDYNALLNCYSDFSTQSKCSAAYSKTNTDFNDDGSVNQADYNLFLRELATQPGQ